MSTGVRLFVCDCTFFVLTSFGAFFSAIRLSASAFLFTCSCFCICAWRFGLSLRVSQPIADTDPNDDTI